MTHDSLTLMNSLLSEAVILSALGLFDAAGELRCPDCGEFVSRKVNNVSLTDFFCVCGWALTIDRKNCDAQVVGVDGEPKTVFVGRVAA